jgi:saccharopine dehydrogenase (NAD+, L-lysine forming)
MKVGIIKEGKIPPDARVPLIPDQCADIPGRFPVDVVVEPSPVRCYQDEEYREAGVPMSSDLGDCDVLLGIKEVPISMLIPDKTYCFFSHTIKEQPRNRKLLQAILEKNIRLIDYEAMTDEKGNRLIAFGYFAGMVGAHNALFTYGLRTGAFQLKRMCDCHDYAEAKQLYKRLALPPVKIVLTGAGRVGRGAAAVLDDMGIRKVSPLDFLSMAFDEAVYTQIDCTEYAAHSNGRSFEKAHFYAHPEEYHSVFAPYYRVADIMINGIFWDSEAPAFFTEEEMRLEDFHIKVIADITCDIAPESSIPSTLRASSIASPVYGYNPTTGLEDKPFQRHVIDIMAIDNLPSEMPRDSSKAFGEAFIKHILPEFLKSQSDVLERATIAENGELGRHFQYLEGYVGEGLRD